MGDGRAPVGKGRNVYAIVSKGGQQQKGSLSQKVHTQDVCQIGPPDMQLKHGIGSGGGKDPPGVELFQHRHGTECPEEVLAGPGVVGLVEIRTELAVVVPALGIDDEMELDQRAALRVDLSGNVIDPVQFSVVIKAQRVVHVDRLGFGNMLEVEICSNHFVGRDPNQNTVEGSSGQPPKGSVLEDDRKEEGKYDK